MAKVTIIITDEEDGSASAEFKPDPEFNEGTAELTEAQSLSIKAWKAITGDPEAAYLEGHEHIQ